MGRQFIPLDQYGIFIATQLDWPVVITGVVLALIDAVVATCAGVSLLRYLRSL